MKQLKLILLILVITGILFGSEQTINQTEELNLIQIKEKAKADAKEDFDRSSKLGWAGSSCLISCGSAYIAAGALAELIGGQMWSMFESETLSESEKARLETTINIAVIVALAGPPATVLFLPVNLPGHREKEIVSKSESHQTAYRSAYKSQIRSKRLSYSLLGPAALLTLLLLIGLSD